MPDEQAGQTGLGILVLLVGQPQGVEPGDDVGVFLPLLAPRGGGGDLRPVDPDEEVIHPVRQRVEFVFVLLALQLQDRAGLRRGALRRQTREPRHAEGTEQ